MAERFEFAPCARWALLVTSMGLLWLGCGTGQDSADDQALTGAEVPPEVAQKIVRAQEALRAGRYRTSLTMLDSAEAISDRVSHLYFLRGRVYAELNQYERSDSAYSQAIALDPSYKGAWQNMGNNALRQGNVREALSRYRREREHNESYQLFVGMGRAYAEINQPDSARYFYRKAIKRDSTRARAFGKLAQLHQARGKTEAAIRAARRAIRLSENGVTHRYTLGTALLDAGRPGQAIPHLREVVGSRPWDPSAHFNLAEALSQVGKEQEARRLQIRVDSLQQVSDQLEEVRTITEMNPREPGPWMKLGHLYRRQGRTGEAMTCYKRARYLDPSNLSAWNNVATLQMQRGRVEKAIQSYRGIVRRDSTLAPVWVNLGVAYARSDRPEEARTAFQRALRLRPDYRRAQLYLEQIGS